MAHWLGFPGLVEIQPHDYECNLDHEAPLTQPVTWPDGRIDECPTACLGQAMRDAPITGVDMTLSALHLDCLREKEVYIEDGVPSRFSLHQLASGTYILATGENDARAGVRPECGGYETVGVYALRGDPRAVQKWFDSLLEDFEAEE